MDLDSPKSELEKSFEKPNTEKAGKDEIASKPDDKPKNNKNDYKDKKIEGASQKSKDKPKNKIEPRKIDPKKEPRHKIERHKSNPLTPPRNKIEPRRIDIQKETRHKIQRQKSNTLTPTRNKIERPAFDPGREPINKIEPRQFTPKKSKNKIEPYRPHTPVENKNKTRNAVNSIKNKPETQPKGNQLKSKWAFVNYDKNGKALSKEDKIEVLTNYFITNVKPVLLRNPLAREKMEKHNALSVNDLTGNGFRDLVRAMGQENKIFWSEFKKSLGFTGKYKSQPQIDFNFLNYDKHGNLLSRQHKFNVSVTYFKENLLPKYKKIPAIQEKLEKGGFITIRDLQNNGDYMFIHNLKKSHKITWNELLTKAGFKINVNQEKYRFINFDKDGQRLSYDLKLKVAKNHFESIILPDLKKVPEIQQKLLQNNPPSVDDIKNHGHPGFDLPLTQKEPKISYNTLVEICGFKVNIDHDKYRFLNYDQNGKLLTLEQKLSVARNIMKNTVIPDLIKKGIINPGDTPGSHDISRGGYSGFVPALTIIGNKILHNDLMISIGLKPNVEIGRWDFLKYDKNGDEITNKEKLERSSKYFLENIYPDLVQKGVINDGQSPTGLDLTRNNHVDFIGAIRSKEPKLTFNQLLEYSGFKPISPQNKEKWKIFYDINNNPLPRTEQISVAVNYFKNEIIPNLIKKGVVTTDQTPDTFTLEKYGHLDFFKAIHNRGILYNEVVIEAGFSPNDRNILSSIGKDFHWNAERIFLEHTIKKNCISFYEVNGNGDNSIIVDENFKKLSVIAANFARNRPNIKIINVDYYLSNSDRVALDHSTRNYQDENKALFLVPVNARESRMLNDDTLFHENVFILDPKSFTRFMGYENELFDDFMESVHLAKCAIYDETSREILNEKSLESIGTIKTKKNQLNRSTKRFKEVVIK